MLKFSSKSDVNAECKCIVRLLDDSEVIECDIQVKRKRRELPGEKKGVQENLPPPIYNPTPFFNRNNKKIRRRRKNGAKITEIVMLY